MTTITLTDSQLDALTTDLATAACWYRERAEDRRRAGDQALAERLERRADAAERLVDTVRGNDAARS